MDINKIDHDHIVKALESKGATLSCSRCGNNSFDVISTTNIPLQNMPNTITAGGPVIPAVYIGCTRCGSLTAHALSVLGLLKEGVS